MLWRAENLDHPQFLATSTATEKSLLLGPQDWSIFNDSCSKGTSYLTPLLMTSCSDSEFTCNSGTCVTMAMRCDGRRDCQDGADEADCKAFAKMLGYNKFLVPPPFKKGEKLILNLTLDIKEILEINEIRNVIQTKFRYQRTWYDSQLTYQNLKKQDNNKVLPSDQVTIWRPWMIYSNTADKNQVIKTETPSILSIIPNSDFIFKTGDNTNLQNTHLFEGSRNALQEEKEYRVEWLCDLHMEWYP